MSRVLLSEEADRDVCAIFAYLQHQAGAPTARRYFAAFNDLYDRLTAFPKLGALRTDLGLGVRAALIAPYLVFYTETPDAIVVLRLLHGNRHISYALVGPNA